MEIAEIKRLPPMNGGRAASIRATVLQYLKNNQKAFAACEIQWNLSETISDRKVGRNTIYQALTRLIKSRKIKKKGSYYWYESEVNENRYK